MEQVDPVLEAIERHRAALETYLDKGKEGRNRFYPNLYGPVDAAFDEIVNTTPTTIAGMRAMLEYLHGEKHQFAGIDRAQTLFMSLLRSPILTE